MEKIKNPYTFISIKEIKANKGILHQMNNGNFVSYNRGDFTIENLKKVFGDLFYGKSKNTI